MAKILQFRRDTAANVALVTPAAGEIFYTTDTKQVRIGDGSTAGGTYGGGPLNNEEVFQGRDNLGTAFIDIVKINSSDEVEFPNGAVFAADKVLALSASGTAKTALMNIGHSGGNTTTIQSFFDDLNILLASSGADFCIRAALDSDDALRVRDDGLITGPNDISSVSATGVNASLIDSNGEHWTSRAGVGGATHIRILNDNGTVGSVSSNNLTTSYNTSSDPHLKNFADDELTIDMVKSDFGKYISTIHAFRFKSNPDGPLILGHDAWEAVDAKLMTGLGSDRIGPRDAELGSEYDTGEVDEDGNPIMGIVSPAGVDQGKVTPMLGLMLDEAFKTIAKLEARIEQLESA